jgi:hypothetical protein
MTNARPEESCTLEGRSSFAIVGTGSSYLALDVYFAEGSGTKLLKKRCAFADFYSVLFPGLLVELFLDDVLGAMRLEEFTADFIVVESELISKEAQGDTNVTVACQQVLVSDCQKCTYALDMLARAASRSRSMKRSIK